jgi:hypothetical protein
MRNFVFMGIVATLLTGCFNEDVSAWDEKKCKEAGFTFEKQEVMNYRTGKAEIRTKCIEK